PSITQLPGLLVLIGVLGIIVAGWRRSPATSFALGWLVMTMLLVSNFLVPEGFITAERTLLLPSVGAMLAVGSAIPWLYARLEGRRLERYAVAAAVVAMLSLGLIRSYRGNPVWRDNETLFRYQVEAAPQRYRAHFMLGLWLFEHDRKAEGEAEYRRALRLFPYDPLMALGLAEQYRKAGMCEPAIIMYRWLYTLEPESNEGHLGFATCLLVTFRLDEARKQALEGIRGGASLRDGRAI